jgi:hypothetical protein
MWGWEKATGAVHEPKTDDIHAFPQQQGQPDANHPKYAEGNQPADISWALSKSPNKFSQWKGEILVNEVATDRGWMDGRIGER